MYAPTSVSSLKYGDGDNAVDGIINSAEVTQCFASDPDIDGDRKRWWTVDLRGPYKITYVKITSRVDCCGQWLYRYMVQAG